MQFICESCKANLQIADEKVRGKRLIVRCKRCGTQIRIADPALAAAQSGARPSTGPIAASRPAATPSAGPVSASQPARKPSTGPIRPAARSSAARDTDAESTRAMDSDLLEKAVRASKGDEAAAASLGRAAPARSAPPPPPPEDLSHRPRDPAVWFAMIGGKQTGPISRAELGLKTAAGQVGPRTYLWKEGMESWVRAKDVTEVSALFGTAPPPPLRDGRAAPPPAQNGEQHGAGLSFDSDPARTQAEQSVEARAQAQIDTPRPEARPGAEPEPAVAAAAEKEGAPASARDAAPDLFGSGPIPSPPAALDLVRWGANELARQRLQTPEAAPKAGPAPGARASQLLLGQTERRSPFRVAIFLLGLAAATALTVLVLFSGREERKEPGAEQAAAKAESPAQPPKPAEGKPAEAEASAAAPALAPEVIHRRVDESKPALQGCVDEALKREPALGVTGRIHIYATIAPSGAVNGARIDKKNVDQSPLGSCLKGATRRIQFPSFSGDAFEVDIPILVTSGE